MQDRLIQGPREKSEATQQFERLVKAILQASHDHQLVEVSYSAAGDMIISVNNQTHNLTDILKNKPDWEQLELDARDISNYQSLLTDSETKYQHLDKDQDLQREGLEKRKAEMQRNFPNLNFEEMSAIRNYTGEFYTAINHLLRSHGTEKFPEPNPNSTQEFDKTLLKFNAGSGTDLNSLVVEVLAHSAVAASALSKPVHDSIPLYTADSENGLNDNLKNIPGLAMVLIGQGETRQFAFVADGEIMTSQPPPDFSQTGQNQIKEPLPTVNLSELFNESLLRPEDYHLQGEALVHDVTKCTQEEIDAMRNELENKGEFREVFSRESERKIEEMRMKEEEKALQEEREPQQFVSPNESLKARFLGRLNTKVDSAHFSPTQELIRGDRRNFFVDQVVEKSKKEIKEQEGSLQVREGFYSTTVNPHIAMKFFSGQPGVLTKIHHPAGYIKNISSISKIQSEQERLAIPNQELLYAGYTVDAQGNTVLHAYPTRSLGLFVPPSDEQQVVQSQAVSDAIEKQKKVVADAEEKMMSSVDQLVNAYESKPVNAAIGSLPAVDAGILIAEQQTKVIVADAVKAVEDIAAEVNDQLSPGDKKQMESATVAVKQQINVVASVANANAEIMFKSQQAAKEQQAVVELASPKKPANFGKVSSIGLFKQTTSSTAAKKSLAPKEEKLESNRGLIQRSNSSN